MSDYVHVREGHDVYPFFKELFPDYQPTEKVLDFGGNRGNLLYHSSGGITDHNYTSIDVSTTALELGKQDFPNATFIHNNKWNWMYNPKGVELPHYWPLQKKFPEVDYKQDYIFAYSVFTHTDLTEFVETLEWLNWFDFKKLAVSVLDINRDEIHKFFYDKRIEDYGQCVDLSEMKGKNIAYLYNNETILYDKISAYKLDVQHFLSLYNIDFLVETLGEYGFNVTIERPGKGIIPFVCMEKK